MPFQIIREDITKLKMDAIVNAANEQLQMGGGVCGSIFRAAGALELQRECDLIGHCPTGDAVITAGHNLPAIHIIHTVGPVWQGGCHNEATLLESCYKKSLHLAKQSGCRSIAFPLISTGIFGYPKTEALHIAVSSIQCFLSRQEMLVYLVIYDQETFNISKKHFGPIMGCQ